MSTTRQEANTQSGAQLMAMTLAAGACVVLVVFLIFAFYHDVSQNSLRRKELDKYLHTVSAGTAWGVDNWLTHRVIVAEDLARRISQSFDGDNALESLKTPLYQQTFFWTYFGEASGDRNIWPPNPNSPASFDPRERPWYQAALRAGETALTEPYFDIGTGVETISVATPVYRNGELLGVAGGDFSAESLSSTLKQTDVGGLGYAFLVSGDGKILAHPERQLVSKHLSDLFPGHTPTVDGNLQYLEQLEQPQIVTFERISALSSVDWYLVLSVDKEAAFENVYEFRQSAAVATIAAALLLIIVLGFVVHRMLVRPLLAARRAADAANVAKSEFLAAMSHEIRTPMNGVLGMAEVLTNAGLNERQYELASIIVSSGNALMAVINDILDFAKLEAGKLRLTPRPFNLRKTVFEVAAMMNGRAHENNVELIVRYAPDLPEGVIADDGRLRQVLSNLVGNAVKFTEDGYIAIDVAGERAGDEVNLTFTVKDTGIGIPPDQIKRMFEKFEQADSSNTRRFGGTGLGLAICKNIIELMDGDIGAESEVGKGSQFWFSLTLPVDDAIQSMPIVDRPIFENLRILAVDDNAVNRRVIQELLDGWGLRSTVLAEPEGVVKALEEALAKNDPYKVILLDHQMPGEDGVMLARRIQARSVFQSLPIILLSSIDGVVTGEDGNNVHIAESLSKPARPSQLMDALVRVMTDSAPHELQNALAALNKVPEPEDAQSTGERVKVLIAEDNAVNQLVISKFIDPHIYETLTADNGEEAVKMFEQHKPAIVLMDLSMPVMDGFEATSQIRAAEARLNWPRTPIVATTAHVMEEDRTRCRQAGMDDFLPKPIRKASLDALFKRWVGAERVDRQQQTA